MCPYLVNKVLPNENYIFRTIITNKTQSLHRNRLRKFTTEKPLEASSTNEKFLLVDDIVNPQADWYSVA